MNLSNVITNWRVSDIPPYSLMPGRPTSDPRKKAKPSPRSKASWVWCIPCQTKHPPKIAQEHRRESIRPQLQSTSKEVDEPIPASLRNLAGTDLFIPQPSVPVPLTELGSDDIVLDDPYTEEFPEASSEVFLSERMDVSSGWETASDSEEIDEEVEDEGTIDVDVEVDSFMPSLQSTTVHFKDDVHIDQDIGDLLARAAADATPHDEGDSDEEPIIPMLADDELIFKPDKFDYDEWEYAAERVLQIGVEFEREVIDAGMYAVFY
jgi:hypothetical protein